MRRYAQNEVLCLFFSLTQSVGKVVYLGLLLAVLARASVLPSGDPCLRFCKASRATEPVLLYLLTCLGLPEQDVLCSPDSLCVWKFVLVLQLVSAAGCTPQEDEAEAEKGDEVGNEVVERDTTGRWSRVRTLRQTVCRLKMSSKLRGNFQLVLLCQVCVCVLLANWWCASRGTVGHCVREGCF